MHREVDTKVSQPTHGARVLCIHAHARHDTSDSTVGVVGPLLVLVGRVFVIRVACEQPSERGRRGGQGGTIHTTEINLVASLELLRFKYLLDFCSMYTNNFPMYQKFGRQKHTGLVQMVTCYMVTYITLQYFVCEKFCHVLEAILMSVLSS